MRPVILIFPGQGSQKPGMGQALADAFPAARDIFQEIDEALGRHLSQLCFEGPVEELTKTRNAQPALFAHGAAVWAVIGEALRGHVVAAAGHSLGELTAYHAAGSVGVADGARLVNLRGQVMYQAGTTRPGMMAAVLGDLQTPLETLCEQATREAGLVVAANYNSEHQIVVSGEVAGVERLMELAKAAGAKRVVPLQVSGAFHSPLMEPAQGPFGETLAATPFADPAFPVYSNVTEQPVSDAATAKDVILQQLTAPVRWVGEVKHMAATYPDALWVELGPGHVLGALVSRIVHGTATLPCGTPSDIDKVMEVIAK